MTASISIYVVIKSHYNNGEVRTADKLIYSEQMFISNNDNMNTIKDQAINVFNTFEGLNPHFAKAVSRVTVDIKVTI